MEDPCIFFIKFPSIQKLCHVVVKIENLKNLPQNQTLKCRQFLFLCRDVLASPNVYDGALLDVVMSLTAFKEKKLMPFCEKLGLKVIHASPVMLNTVQECLTFTFQFKMSPSWTRVGPFLVKGSDVATCAGKQDAVDFSVTVSHEQITLTVMPHAIRNPPPTLEDFSICFQALQNFRHDNQDSIEEYSIYQSWCHIMPSMKRGQLVKVTRTIPQREYDSPFTDYAGLKKYWRNHHGIKLPDTDNGMLYGSVYFKLIGPQLFTYPLCGLRTRDIQILPRCDGPAIIKDFMAAVNLRLDRICGFKMLITSKPCYASSTLNEVFQIAPENFHNVTTNPKLKPLPPPKNAPACIYPRKDQDIILSSQVNTSESKPGTEKDVIPSSQLSERNQHRTVLKNLPLNNDGKYIPTFGIRKKAVAVSSTSNCARKINFNVTKKKPIANAIYASATVSREHKTPRQDAVNMNDSGYCADDTPIANNENGDKITPAKKLQPKKLHFGPGSIASNIPDVELSVKMKQLQARHRRLFPSAGPAKNASINSSAAPSNDSGCVGSEKTTQASPLRILKNHAFDQLFSKAGAGEGKICEVSDIKMSNPPELKVMKNHQFDKLFSKAGDRNARNASDIEISQPPDLKAMKNHQSDKLFSKAGDSNPGNTLVIKVSDQSDVHLNVMKDHKFDKLFTKAGDQPEVKPGHERGVSESQHSQWEILQNHKFDQLFAKARDCHTSRVSCSSNEDKPGCPFATSKNHDDSGIDPGHTSPPKMIPKFFKSINSNSSDNVPELLRARNCSHDEIHKNSCAQSSCSFQNANATYTRIFEGESSAKSSVTAFRQRNATTSTVEPHLFDCDSSPETTPSSSTKSRSFTSDCSSLNATSSTEKPLFDKTSETTPSGSTFHISETHINFKQIIYKNMQVSQESAAPKIHETATTSTSTVDRDRPKYNFDDVVKRFQSEGRGDVKWDTSQDRTWSKKQDGNIAIPAKKRLGDGTGCTSTSVKRSRMVQDVNMEYMALSGNLHKVNIPTLASWLKSNGVSATSRWKKHDLVEKVKFQLSMFAVKK